MIIPAGQLHEVAGQQDARVLITPAASNGNTSENTTKFMGLVNRIVMCSPEDLILLEVPEDDFVADLATPSVRLIPQRRGYITNGNAMLRPCQWARSGGHFEELT